MVCKRWKLFYGIALALGIQGAFAGEAWLVITSDPPGAAVLVDDAYRGTTPQRSGDALRIRVPQGTHEIDASVRMDGKDYVARRIVETRGDRENLVQINLRQEITRASTLPITPPVQASEPQLEMKIPLGELTVPGRNF